MPTPNQKDIVEALLRRKKQELLEMYVIDADDLDQLEKQAKQPAPAPAVAGPALVPAAEARDPRHKSECVPLQP